MELLSTEDEFTGIFYDLEIEPGKKDKSSVNGFTEDEIISFIKRYEHAIYLDEEAENSD